MRWSSRMGDLQKTPGSAPAPWSRMIRFSGSASELRRSNPYTTCVDVNSDLAPAAALLLVPFASDWPDTYRAVVVQPQFPDLVCPTPWLSFAPHIANETWMGGRSVAGGPTRLISLAIAIGVGVWFMRKERPPQMLVWCVAFALALRFLLETGVAPYYVWPPLALVVVSGALQPWKRLSMTCACVLGVTWLANARIYTEWIWWPICAGLVLSLVVAFPAKGRERATGTTAAFTEVERATLERV